MRLGDKEKQIYSYFSEIRREDAAVLAPFEGNSPFGDTTFTLFYAWVQQFHYAYRLYENTACVLEYGVDNRLSCILLWKRAADITPVVAEMYELFCKAGLPLYFEYVSEAQLPLYIKAADGLGNGIEITALRDNSDYVYETAAFMAMDGRPNKGKRGGVNVLLREYPDIHIVFHVENTRDLRGDSLSVFDQWCAAHDCASCFYGCEKTAFLRFLDIFDARRHALAVSYAGGVPLSFAAKERITPDTDCYYFQKNAQRIRGLTYWLDREMALQNPDIPYLNFGEDMGLPGLRQDKTNLHPCRHEAKYTVRIL